MGRDTQSFVAVLAAFMISQHSRIIVAPGTAYGQRSSMLDCSNQRSAPTQSVSPLMVVTMFVGQTALQSWWM